MPIEYAYHGITEVQHAQDRGTVGAWERGSRARRPDGGRRAAKAAEGRSGMPQAGWAAHRAQQRVEGGARARRPASGFLDPFTPSPLYQVGTWYLVR